MVTQELINELKELKEKTKNLIFFDIDTELDDVIRKTKMYLKNIFEPAQNYIRELERIRFKEEFIGDDSDDIMWNRGKSQLTSFLDTRIKEAEILLSEQNRVEQEPIIKEVIVEKIIEVEDTEVIDELNVEITRLKRKLRRKSFLDVLKSVVVIGIILTVFIASVGGAYNLGKDNGGVNMVQKNSEIKNRLHELEDSIKGIKTNEEIREWYTRNAEPEGNNTLDNSTE